MKKYVVKNCPAFQKELITMDFKTGETTVTENDKNICIGSFKTHLCQDCTNCLLKQIIKKCKDETNKCKKCETFEMYQFCLGKNIFAKNLLEEFFDIQEVD